MKIYLAGERSFEAGGVDKETRFIDGEPFSVPLAFKGMRRRLFSYFYHNHKNEPSKDITLSAKLGMDLFLDSGAFTAFSKGVEISIEEYADFVKRTRHLWTTCSSLDAIGQGEEAARQSYENFVALRDLGADVQPVFHVREPDHWLQRYIDEGWDYIFIGGMVPETTRWLLSRLDHLWSTVLSNEAGEPLVKTHGFGLTDQKLMFRYPWHSVDSTSWLMTGIFGACVFRTPSGQLRKVVFSDESPQARKVNGWHYSALSEPEKRQVDTWLEPYGVTGAECGLHYSYRDMVNAAVFQNLEDLGVDSFVRRQETLFG